jgi:hypothetical protein
MTFAFPFFAWVSGLVALATVALHLLAWRRPPESPLPTARFAPERPVRMVSRAVRPADLALLALRVAIILLVGVALARPEFSAQRNGTARVVVVDRSRFSGTGADVATAARSVFRPGDALVLFDSAAREIAGPTPDSIDVPASSAAGALSPALVGAVRAAGRLARVRDSVAIVIVSPFAASEVDGATAAIRRVWPGPVRLVRAGAPPNDTRGSARPDVRAPRADPVAASVALLGKVRGGADVRVVRNAAAGTDSAWAREGRTVVVWPREAGAPAGWSPRASLDTAFGVTAYGASDGSVSPGSATVVASMTRTAIPPAGRVVARWSDGEPAATESALGDGCIRSVAIAVPPSGDLPITSAFRRLAEQLVRPCSSVVPWAAASDSVLAAVLPLAGRHSSEVAASVIGEPVPSTLTAWLLGLALLAASAEMFVRRGGGANATA